MKMSMHGQEGYGTRYSLSARAIGLAVAGVLSATLGVGIVSGQAKPVKEPKAEKAERPAKANDAKIESGSKPGGAMGGAATKPSTQPSASSLIEDRAARKLLTAGDNRMQLDQAREALELYQQVVERYPRSNVRFEAFMRMGKYQLDKARDPGKAIQYFERAADETNEVMDIRGEAMLMVGRCHYEQQKFQQAFASLRQVINLFPGTEFSNQAYFYIGNAHYKLGAFNRAIEAFSKVGTAVSETEQGKRYMEIGKRLFVRISDQDLTALPEGTITNVTVTANSGDAETVKLVRIGAATSPNYIAEIDTTLGDVAKGDGILQVRGDDNVSISYIDAQTTNKEVNVERKQELSVVHNAIGDFMDGAFRDPLKSLVVGKTAYVRVIDLDRDLTAGADTVTVKVIAKRQINKAVKALHEKDEAEGTPAPAPATAPKAEKKAEVGTIELPGDEDAEAEKKPEFKIIDEATLVLTERPREEDDEAATKAGENGNQGQSKPTSIHSGVFGGQVPVLPGEPVTGDSILQVQTGDILEIVYEDKINITGKTREVRATVQTVTGSLGDVKVANQEIRDQQLELQTRLKKAEALTNIGRIYKQLGLKEQADHHFKQGVEECEALASRARNLGGDVLETMYVRLWRLYLELEELDKAATICLALQKEFPNSQFVDEALLGLGETSMKKNEYDKAIGVFKRVLDLPLSSRKADALFMIGLCQEKLAQPARPVDKPNQGMLEAAFLSFQQVFQKYPTSGVAGDAVGKMADFYMNNKDYDRAISTFQQALDEYPDAQFTDRILYDYGRCLFRMQRTDDALGKFRQLMSEYPQSKLAPKAKQIVAALEKRNAGGGSE